MNLTKDNYITLLHLIKGQIIDYHTPGPGIILRHDIDDFFEKSLAMARIEHELKVKSTYFVLNTAEYWDNELVFPMLLSMQNDMGHGIGWHNNAVTEHLTTEKPIRDCISDPIEQLRSFGLIIRGSVAHGDKLCREKNYLNSDVFGLHKRGWDGYKGLVYDMKEFGLEYEASFLCEDDYLSDSGAQWSKNPDLTLNKWLDYPEKRYQILIHPQHWQL